MPEVELDEARGEFEARLDNLRRSMDHKLGLRPRRPVWWILLLAGAVGMALAGRARSRGELDD